MNRRSFTGAMAAAAVGAMSARRVAWGAQQAGAEQAGGGEGFELSVMLWTVFRDLPFEQRLERVAEAGYHRVELVGEYKDWSDADFARVNAARKRLGITFDATAGLPHGAGDPAGREAFLADWKQAIPTMERLEIPAMIVLSGNVIAGRTREEQHAATVEALKQAVKPIEGRTMAGEPMRLLLECIDPEENPKYFLTSAAEAMEIVRAVNHPQVQFLYDFYHEQIGHGNLLEKLEKNIDLVGLVHVADVPGRHQPGTGEINYASVYGTLKRLGYKRTVAMEFLPLGDEVEALRVARGEVG